MDDLVERPLQEGRVDRRDGPDALQREAASEQDRLLLGDADVEVALGERLLELSAWRLSAESWTRPGLALLGDAAHCVHPMAGQGMNAAIGDAWALTRALGEAARLDAAGVDAALERYERERRPRLEYVSRLSHNLAKVFTDTSPLARRLYGRMLRVNSANRRLQYILTYNVSGLGVRRFTRRDRLYQFGILSDPRAGEAGL